MNSTIIKGHQQKNIPSTIQMNPLISQSLATNQKNTTGLLLDVMSFEFTFPVFFTSKVNTGVRPVRVQVDKHSNDKGSDDS